MCKVSEYSDTDDVIGLWVSCCCSVGAVLEFGDLVLRRPQSSSSSSSSLSHVSQQAKVYISQKL